MSGSSYCCRLIFYAVLGRRRNKLRNAVGIIGLSFFSHEYRIVKIAHTCSRTRSEDQFLQAKVQFILVPPPPPTYSAPSLRLLKRRHCIHMASKRAKIIEMALKSLFLPQNHKNHPAAGRSAHPGSLCDALELHQFVQLVA